MIFNKNQKNISSQCGYTSNFITGTVFFTQYFSKKQCTSYTFRNTQYNQCTPYTSCKYIYIFTFAIFFFILLQSHLYIFIYYIEIILLLDDFYTEEFLDIFLLYANLLIRFDTFTFIRTSPIKRTSLSYT